MTASLDDNHTAGPQAGSGRPELDRMLARMAPDDLRRSLETLERLLEGGRAAVITGSLVPLVTDPTASSALKLIGFFIQRSARLWVGRPLGESVAALKDLLWLRARLRAILLGHAAEQPDTAAGTAAGPAQSDPQRASVALVYQLCVGRTPADAEIDIWVTNFANGLSFQDFLLGMHGSPEAQARRTGGAVLPAMADGQFIQAIYECVVGRGCTPKEIEVWEKQLTAGWMSREGILQSLFNDQATELLRTPAAAAEPASDGLSCHVMGRNQKVTLQDWQQRARDLRGTPAGADPVPASQARFHIRQKPGPLVSAIASLYRGGRYIERFMDNITSQSCFRDYCELVIVDADSPENESQVIERFCRQFPNIVYHRVNYRIGIYDAWNVGVKMARGAYCTNTNLDDLRRQDSLELQAATLDNLPFVDVVYQDFLYTFDPDLSVADIARFGYTSDLPIVNAANMMYFNSPHNAPMWRKKLHAELGYFDIFYKSAGDYEFWMRCLAAGKVFYKLNDPHVVYYQNPEGLSTRPGSRGIEEAKHILKTYGRKLVSPNILMSRERFLDEQLNGLAGQDTSQGRYAAVQRALRATSVRARAGERHAQGGGAA